MGRVFQLVGPEPDEHELQISCTNMLNVILLPGVVWTAVDHAHSPDRRMARNGRVSIGFLEMRKRRERGVKPGIPDYLFWHRARAFAIELKVGDNKLDDDQRTFATSFIHADCFFKVCWTKDQVFETVRDWELTRPMHFVVP
jgi:hypothetical protein